MLPSSQWLNTGEFFYSLDGLVSNTDTNKSPDVCFPIAEDIPFPHPSGLASSYTYLTSFVDSCLAFLSAQCSSHTCPAAAGWNSAGRGEEAGACWNLQAILLPVKLGDKDLQEGDQNAVSV